LEFSILGSGSKGNCTYIEEGGTALLIDAGFSPKEIGRRLSVIGKDISDINAVFITHDHSDHIRGAEKLARMLPLHSNILAGCSRVEGRCEIGSLEIRSFCVSHDANDPRCFSVHGKKSFGVFTDLGFVPDTIREEVRSLDAVSIEANHDVDMLINGRYPYILKQRILGDRGHLSNIDAGLLVRDEGENLKHAVLSHLSEHNNDPGLAIDTFKTLVARPKLKIAVSDQDVPTELRRI